MLEDHRRPDDVMPALGRFLGALGYSQPNELAYQFSCTKNLDVSLFGTSPSN